MEHTRGFTLTEMLLSIGIISLLAGISLPIYVSFQTRNDLETTTQGIVEMLRRAETYTRAVYGDSQWGVAIRSGSATLFKGASYASRDTTYDETVNISTGMNTSGLTDIVFTKLTAAPSTTGNITLTSNSNESRTISINAQGMVSY